jgi:hypothetical protein
VSPRMQMSVSCRRTLAGGERAITGGSCSPSCTRPHFGASSRRTRGKSASSVSCGPRPGLGDAPHAPENGWAERPSSNDSIVVAGAGTPTVQRLAAKNCCGPPLTRCWSARGVATPERARSAASMGGPSAASAIVCRCGDRRDDHHRHRHRYWRGTASRNETKPSRADRSPWRRDPAGVGSTRA